MSSDNKDGKLVINEKHIREIVMPPYEYQKPELGFGMMIFEQPVILEKPLKDRPTTTKSK